MLKQLCIKNMYNFKNEIILDFITHENSQVLKSNFKCEDVASISLIYGKNNVGKSNLFNILWRVKDFVLNNTFDINYYRPSGKNLESLFEIIVVDNDNEYRYGFSIDILNKRKISEWLYKTVSNKEVLIFEDSNSDLSLSINKYTQATTVLSFFENLVIIKDDSQFEVVNRLINLSDMNFNIMNKLIKASDLDIDFIKRDDQSIRFIKGFETIFDYSELSSGTKRLLSISVSILSNLNNKSLFLIDELDSGLHLQLINLIMTFIKYAILNSEHLQVLASIHREDLLDFEYISNENKIFLHLNEKDEIEVSYLSQYYLDNEQLASNRYKLNAFMVNPNTSSEYEMITLLNDLSRRKNE